MPAHEHRFQHSGGECILGRLREKSQCACTLATRLLCKPCAVEEDFARLLRPQARKRVERQSLAAAVSTEDCSDLRRFEYNVETADEHASCDRDIDVRAGKSSGT